jgi:flagellar hook-associated protein 3 FlgL
MGNNAQRVEAAMGHLEEVKIDLKMILSRYEDADIIETLTSLSQQETAFEAALNVTAKVSKLSILNYL